MEFENNKQQRRDLNHITSSQVKMRECFTVITHEQKLYFASGVAGASDAWGIADANCHSGYRVPDAFHLGANIMLLSAPGANRKKF